MTLGGGYGWLTAQHGLAIDNLVEVRVENYCPSYAQLTISAIQVTLVTASGEIFTVNSTKNSDLFWGVRGGGENFGVAINFVLKLYPQPRKVFAGPVIFPPPMLGTMVSALEEWLSTATPSANATLVFAHGPDGNPAVIVVVVYHGGEEEGKKAFKPIFDLGEDTGVSRICS